MTRFIIENRIAIPEHLNTFSYGDTLHLPDHQGIAWAEFHADWSHHADQPVWFSILGSSPFALLLPYCNMTWTIILAILVGMVMSSAMSAILVYGTELLPGNVGMISGAFFGLSFGLGGIGSALFGWIADLTSIQYVFQLTAFLPLLGIAAYFLPNIKE
jgi:MFS family permease